MTSHREQARDRLARSQEIAYPRGYQLRDSLREEAQAYALLDIADAIRELRAEIALANDRRGPSLA